MPSEIMISDVIAEFAAKIATISTMSCLWSIAHSSRSVDSPAMLACKFMRSPAIAVDVFA